MVNNISGLRKQIFKETMSYEEIESINSFVYKYFNILSLLYLKNDTNKYNDNDTNIIDNFFLKSNINNTFYLAIKIQISLFSLIFVCLSHLPFEDIKIKIKNYFYIFIKKSLNALLYIFNFYIKNEISLNFPEVIDEDLKLLYENDVISNENHNSKDLLCNLDLCIKEFINFCEIYKNSKINPFFLALNQLLENINRKSLNQFSTIILTILLYGELNKKKKKCIII